MKLYEIYQEENTSELTHNGRRYHLNTLFDLVDTNPVKMIKVSLLDWILPFATIDEKREASADLTAPLLVVIEDEKYVAIDGAHRLNKAVKQGTKYLPCILVSPAQLAAAEI